ncbi:hypothetical protein QWZ13_14265 [Reinekea marina]|uniref:hypothetical protein n=1 Tax=Reinekea marina TaxID=1310421 RepID=UPI0025B2A869|nr:hypothetical protein [Reinekea marina]MDN3650080.1 hypothetical protein [Reinekea marina]
MNPSSISLYQITLLPAKATTQKPPPSSPKGGHFHFVGLTFRSSHNFSVGPSSACSESQISFSSSLRVIGFQLLILIHNA